MNLTKLLKSRKGMTGLAVAGVVMILALAFLVASVSYLVPVMAEHTSSVTIDPVWVEAETEYEFTLTVTHNYPGGDAIREVRIYNNTPGHTNFECGSAPSGWWLIDQTGTSNYCQYQTNTNRLYYTDSQDFTFKAKMTQAECTLQTCMHTFRTATIDIKEPQGEVYYNLPEVYVDCFDPETTKTYGTPYKAEPGCVAECESVYPQEVEWCVHKYCTQWITTSTPVTLTATDDTSVCDSGVDKIYWANNIVDDKACNYPGDYCKPVDTGYNEHEGNTVTFYKEQESCHLIQYYTVDKVGNEEGLQWQCVFVDDTPPLSVKTHGTPLEGDEGFDWVTQETQITLDCDDSREECDSHPVKQETLCYRVSLHDEPDPLEYLTLSYCTEFGGIYDLITEYCCAYVGDDLQETKYPIHFLEDSYHNLEYYCIDHLGNDERDYNLLHPPEMGEITQDGAWIQWYKVDSVSATIEKNMFGSYLGDCPDGTYINHGDCYVADDGTSGVDIIVTDGGEICAIDNLECFYKLYWEMPQGEECPGPMSNDLCVVSSGDFSESAHIVFTEDSTHYLWIYCEDELGNSVEHMETFLVDSTPPVTEKEYGTPTKVEEGYRWITSDTPITLTAEDEKVGVYETYWRNTLLEIPDEACLEQCNCESPLEEVFETVAHSHDGTSSPLAIITKTNNGDSVTFAWEFIKENIPHPDKYTLGIAFATSLANPDFQIWIDDSSLEWKHQEYGTGWDGAVTTGKSNVEALGFTLVGDSTGKTKSVTVPYSKLGGIPCSTYYFALQARTNIIDKYPSTWTPWSGNVNGYAQSTIGGLGDWNTYDLPFYKPEESCHLIEYYSVDLLGNEEELNWQCVFVDNRPPEPVKKLGEPKLPLNTLCSGDLTNPGFETGDLTGWTVEASPDSVTVVTADGYTSPVEGTYMVSLGDDNGGGSQAIGDNTISQWFTVTETTLTFAYNIFTFDYSGFNHFGYKVIDEAGVVIYQYNQGAWGPSMDTSLKTTGWQSVSLDVSAYMGQQLQLVISSGGTSDTLYSYWTYVDCGVKDWYVTTNTKITLECVDPEPHPVEQETLYWRFSTYTDGFDGNPTYEPGPNEWYSESYEGLPIEIQFPTDCWHDLEYYCVDHLGNAGEIHTQYYIVDTEPPIINKTVSDPHIECLDYEGELECYQIDTKTEIWVDVYDPEPHPVNDVWCEWSYLWNAQEYGPYLEEDFPFQIVFGDGEHQESEHDLYIYCEDALGNSVEDEEMFVVDKTPPETTKTYDGLQYPVGVAHPTHITSETEVWLYATDNVGPHDSGVAKTFYRDVYLPDENDWKYCYEVCAEWENDPRYSAYGLPTAPEPYNPKSVDPSWEEWTGEPFYKSPESCHIIEYYSYDNVEKVEKPKWQCVFVDDTGPLVDKEIGEPKEDWEGDNTFYPDLIERCENEIDCFKVTLGTPLSLLCEDQQPHPVDDETMCFKIELDGYEEYQTEKYCDSYGGEGVDEDQDEYDEWCCVHGGIEEFYFLEESQHDLEVKCIDALGNEGDIDEEKFKVEGCDFTIPLYKKWNLISVPFEVFDNDPAVVFGDVADKIESIWTYDNGVWYSWKPGIGGNLDTIKPGWGYWILANGEAEVLIAGSLLSFPETVPPSKDLQEGWNLIGYYGKTMVDGLDLFHYNFDTETCYVPEKPVYCALNTLVDTQQGFPRWGALWTYYNEGDDKAYWYGLDACCQEEWFFMYNDVVCKDYMQPGQGYWIEMDVEDSYSPATNCIWDSDNVCVDWDPFHYFI